MIQEKVTTDTEQIRQLLLLWMNATRLGKRDEVLHGHHPEALIFDVLPPLLYRGTEAYRAGWDSWQPETEGDDVFEFTELDIVADQAVAYATGLIKCGGTLANGKPFQDLVRATFCLRKSSSAWAVTHQHISKPAGS